MTRLPEVAVLRSQRDTYRDRALRAEAEVRALREAQGELLEALRPFTSTERYSITRIDGLQEMPRDTRIGTRVVDL